MAHRFLSVSLPARIRPAISVSGAERKLSRTISWESSPSCTSEDICNGITDLVDMCDCVDALLIMQSTRETIYAHKNKKWVMDLLDRSEKIFDVCSASRNNLWKVKGLVQDIQSALRRRKNDSSLENAMAKFLSFREAMTRDAKAQIKTLMQKDHKGLPIKYMDYDCASLINILAEVSELNMSVLRSLLSFLAARSSSSSKTSRWLVSSRLINLKPRLASSKNEDETVNEFASLDTSIGNYVSTPGLDMEKTQLLLKKLTALEGSIQRMENCLESLSRRVVRSRVSLLNMISYK